MHICTHTSAHTLSHTQTYTHKVNCLHLRGICIFMSIMCVRVYNYTNSFVSAVLFHFTIEVTDFKGCQVASLSLFSYIMCRFSKCLHLNLNMLLLLLPFFFFKDASTGMYMTCVCVHVCKCVHVACRGWRTLLAASP